MKDSSAGISLTASDMNEAKMLLTCDPKGDPVRRIAFALRDARKKSQSMTGEMWGLYIACVSLNTLVPLDATLEEQKLAVRKFRDALENVHERYSEPKENRERENMRKEIEAILKKEYKDPLTIIEVREVLDRVTFMEKKEK